MNRLKQYPDNWWEAIGLQAPLSYTKEQIDAAHREFIEDVPSFYVFIQDLKQNLEILASAESTLSTKQIAQIKRYSKHVDRIHKAAKELFEMMRIDYEEGGGDAPTDRGAGLPEEDSKSGS
jgi:hypothetical protein